MYFTIRISFPNPFIILYYLHLTLLLVNIFLINPFLRYKYLRHYLIRIIFTRGIVRFRQYRYEGKWRFAAILMIGKADWWFVSIVPRFQPPISCFIGSKWPTYEANYDWFTFKMTHIGGHFSLLGTNKESQLYKMTHIGGHFVCYFGRKDVNTCCILPNTIFQSFGCKRGIFFKRKEVWGRITRMKIHTSR
jgi:hypothetical protein